MNSPHQDPDTGKTFTQVIHKQNIPVIIQTLSNRITGQLHVRESERIKDALNTSERFIALTDVRVFDFNGQKELYTTKFLAVNLSNTIWVVEEKNKGTGPK